MDKQPSRLSDNEKEQLRSFFKDNDALLLTLRNLLFGFELDPVELDMVKPLVGIKKTLRKMLLPELSKDIPLGQSIDLWMTVKLEKDRDELHIKSREMLIDTLETALSLIEKPRKVNLLKVDKTPEGLMNRNTFISHVEQQLAAIKAIANEKAESEEEKAMRLAKDSLK